MTIDPGLLEPGEKILWSTQPHAADFASQRGIVASAFGLLFTGISMFAAFGVYQKGGLEFLFACGFVLLGVYITLTPARRYYEAKHTTYALTNRRALTNVSGFNPRRRSVPLQQIRYVEMQPSDEKGVGNIYFQDVLQVDAEGSSLVREGFMSVPDAENAERLLRRALESLPDNRLRVVSA